MTKAMVQYQRRHGWRNETKRWKPNDRTAKKKVQADFVGMNIKWKCISTEWVSQEKMDEGVCGKEPVE